ncbi:TetR/AcrR family transcriptional regulator [Lysobacter firmicutimachus]|uniref:TetR/AcrR family transcriptional regulator n=1 Tax=Lysobacter firmicutimachus TaxID=1792846 RepID=A0ABU8CXP5_9GAMM
MRYTPDRKPQTRQRVLDQAARALHAEGPHRLGVAAIMREAGLTHGGFYAHFASRDELLAAAIERMFEQARDYWREAFAGQTPAQALRICIDRYLSPAHRDGRLGGCPLPPLSADLPHLPDAARAAYEAGAQRMHEGLRALIAAHRPGQDAEQQALSMRAELVGALLLARAQSARERSDALLAASREALHARFGLD